MIKKMMLVVIMAMIMATMMPSVAAEEKCEIMVIDYHHYHSRCCYKETAVECKDIPANIEAIINDDGKISLFHKMSRNTISLKGQEVLVVASVDGIESQGAEYVATVTDSYYRENGDMVVKMYIDANYPFETIGRMDKDGSVRLVHFTGVTYFLKDIVPEKRPVVGSTIQLRGSITGNIISAYVTGISIDDSGDKRVKIMPGDNFWTDFDGHKNLVFNENLHYEIVDETVRQRIQLYKG